MIASDVVAATLFLALASVLGNLVLVLPLAFLAAIAELPMLSAPGAAIPTLAAEEDLSWANGLMLLSEALAVMVGPAVGGFLADAWGRPGPGGERRIVPAVRRHRRHRAGTVRVRT